MQNQELMEATTRLFAKDLAIIVTLGEFLKKLCLNGSLVIESGMLET